METGVLEPPAAPPPAHKQQTMWWVVAGVAVLAVVGAAIGFSHKSSSATTVGPLVYDTSQPANSAHNLQSHWHAALGVYDCDHWLGDSTGDGVWVWPSATPDGRPARVDEPNTYAGMHSHDDGVIHMEATSPEDAGRNATLGQYFREGGWSVVSSGYTFLDVHREDGGKCGDQPGTLNWWVNGKQHTGDPALYKLYNDDVVVVAFVPDGVKVPTDPPSKSHLPDAVNKEGDTAVTMPTLPGSGSSAKGKPCVAETATPPKGAPAVPVEVGPPPTKLVIKDLTPGTGAEVQAGATVTVNYIGVACSTGAVFDQSYTKQPIAFPLTGVIPGFRDGLIGMKVGGRRLLGIPPDQGYGNQGAGPQVAPGETLWFVIDLVKVG
jgi:peptidylprolyl isomerase